MLLHESRRAARTSASGDIVLLGDQQRSLWNRAQIGEGSALVARALASGRFGPYTLQAAIAAVHANAASAEATDWNEIVGLYDLLLRVDVSPVVELNRAVAVAMRDGAAAGLVVIDAILARGDPGTTSHTRRGPTQPAPRRCRRGARIVRAGRRTRAARTECRFLERRLAGGRLSVARRAGPSLSLRAARPLSKTTP